MMMKTIETLIEDIDNIFKNSEHKISEDNLNELGESIKECVRTSIEEANNRRAPTLRMSNFGKPRRQLWYELKNGTADSVVEYGENDVFEPDAQKLRMFLFGDIIEQLLVFFIKEAGHTIEYAQEELEVGGILGHTDGAIDRVPADIKSASKWNFAEKFVKRGLLKDEGGAEDPYGYKGQISGYREDLLKKYPDKIDPDKVAWLAFNKETAALHLLVADPMEHLFNAEDRVKLVQNDLAKETPPEEKCYPDQPDGESGNRVLHKHCTWCSFKDHCWKDANNGEGLRVFNYSNGPKYFTRVEKAPRVQEISDTMFKIEE